MMGDNRDDSQDSRYWGFLPKSYVKGRALFIYWSFDTPEDGSAPGGPLWMLTHALTGTRWDRLLHQIH
jgi:signal peptidase I